MESTNGVAPYRPLARSLMNVALSSRNAGTYATAMKLINADPKNWKVSQGYLTHTERDKLTIALMNGWICSCVVPMRTHTVPIIIARPTACQLCRYWVY